MIVTIFAALLLQAAATPTPTLPHDSRPEPREDSIQDRLERTADTSTPTTPEALQAIQAYGSCAADRSPDMAARTLRMDYRTGTYQNALQNLSRNNRTCFRRGRMQSNTMLFAGAMAERLLAQDTTALNGRLARVASQPAPAGFGPNDAFAHCVVRAMPDEVSALLATAWGTEAEASALSVLRIGIERCGATVAGRVTFSPAGLRAVLALTAFRAVSPEPTES